MNKKGRVALSVSILMFLLVSSVFAFSTSYALKAKKGQSVFTLGTSACDGSASFNIDGDSNQAQSLCVSLDNKHDIKYDRVRMYFVDAFQDPYSPQFTNCANYGETAWYAHNFSFEGGKKELTLSSDAYSVQEVNAQFNPQSASSNGKACVVTELVSEKIDGESGKITVNVVLRKANIINVQ